MGIFRFIVGLAVVAPMTLAIPALAKDKGEGGEPKSQVDPNEQVCRRVIPTGSMMSKKICQTRAQWSAAEGHARDQMSRNRQLQGGAGQGGGQ